MYEKDSNRQGQQSGSPSGTVGQRSGVPTRGETQFEGKFFVNGQPVQNIQESRPTVRQILQAADQDVENVEVYKLSNMNDATGRKIGLDERIEATNEACYLRCETQGEESERSLGLSDIEGSSTPGQRTGGGDGSGSPGGARNPVGGAQRQVGTGAPGSNVGSTTGQGQTNVAGTPRATEGAGAQNRSGTPRPSGGEFQGGQTGGATKGASTETQATGGQPSGVKKEQRPQDR